MNQEQLQSTLALIRYHASSTQYDLVERLRTIAKLANEELQRQQPPAFTHNATGGLSISDEDVDKYEH